MKQNGALNKANMYFGRCSLNVYKSCSSRKAGEGLAEEFLKIAMRIGGYVEGASRGCRNAETEQAISSDMNEVRFMVKLMFDGKLASDRSIRKFLYAATELESRFAPEENVVGTGKEREPRLVEVKASAATDEPVVVSRRKSRHSEIRAEIAEPFADPDGFNEPYYG